MGKVIFGILIAAIVWILFFAKRKINTDQSTTDQDGRVRQKQQPERMVSCARCGVNIPESEAEAGANGSYTCRNVNDCSTSH